MHEYVEWVRSLKDCEEKLANGVLGRGHKDWLSRAAAVIGAKPICIFANLYSTNTRHTQSGMAPISSLSEFISFGIAWRRFGRLAAYPGRTLARMATLNDLIAKPSLIFRV